MTQRPHPEEKKNHKPDLTFCSRCAYVYLCREDAATCNSIQRAHIQSMNINRVLGALGDMLRISPYEIHQKAKQNAASQKIRTPRARLRTQQKSRRRGWRWRKGGGGWWMVSKEEKARNQSEISVVPLQRARKQTEQRSVHKAAVSVVKK